MSDLGTGGLGNDSAEQLYHSSAKTIWLSLLLVMALLLLVTLLLFLKLRKKFFLPTSLRCVISLLSE